MRAAQFRWWLQQWNRRAGVASFVALGLLISCGLGYWLAILPLQEQLYLMQTSLTNAARHNPPPAVRHVAREALNTFYANVPSVDSQFALLARLHKAASSQGLILEHGDYQFTRETGSPLMRYEIELPVKGDYAQIRRFVSTAMMDSPTLALRSITFSRQKSDDAQLTATLVLVLYLKKEDA
ncbi:hypothetical protein [Massilia horti]|uniref:Uncharacterized protein n=1 Tax=Massilia horti TaxID=2562153 RepID=A0A4Y9T956_9BURK|nr:hypothetical protein [Massilia horti]TFW34407.1 hypothetical protein E4O92_04185 [Massilia horti]